MTMDNDTLVTVASDGFAEMFNEENPLEAFAAAIYEFKKELTDKVGPDCSLFCNMQCSVDKSGNVIAYYQLQVVDTSLEHVIVSGRNLDDCMDEVLRQFAFQARQGKVTIAGENNAEPSSETSEDSAGTGS